MRSGFDAVAMNAADWRTLIVPQNPSPDLIGAYINGFYANRAAARVAFPNALLYTYDVNGSRPDADVLDVEPRDAVPQVAGDWARRHNSLTRARKTALRGPGLYGSASIVSQIVSNMLDSGFKRSDFIIQSAHYTGVPHVCGPDTCGYPQADATQYIDHGPHGENTDLSVWEDHCFPPAKPRDPDARYDLFDNRRRSLIGGATERDTVREYDRWRATQTHSRHPHRVRLALLRLRLRLLARRLQAVIYRQGHPTTNQKWRLRELQDRAAGKRLV